MGSGASSLPPVEGFGQNGNVAIDRSSRLDLPWKLALTEIGSDVDVETLQKMADSCSDQELHCCRAFFRAFRALPLSEMDETEQELCKQMYFVTAHSPKSLLVFYSILHQCALLKIDSLEPIPEAASLFVQTCLDTYTTEKGFENALQVEHIKVDAMRGIVCSYLEELLDVLTNAALAEPCMEMVDGIPVYTLEADPIEVRVGAQGGDLLRLRVNGKDIFLQDEKSETRKDIFRCASAPENSSLCNQVFYLESDRREFSVDADGILMIRQTSLDAKPLSFVCCSEFPNFSESTESSSLQILGKLEGIAEVSAANARVRVVDNNRIVIDGTNNWLVKLKFFLV